jgi:hypothetical protein
VTETETEVSHREQQRLDRVLEQNYLQLLTTYPAIGAVGRRIKADLIQRLQIMRPDAALCLLTLYDQMILRPYTGRMRLFSRPGRRPPMVDKRFGQRVLESYSLILEELEKTARANSTQKLSSHDVLRAVDARWEQLSHIFWWAA